MLRACGTNSLHTATIAGLPATSKVVRVVDAPRRARSAGAEARDPAVDRVGPRRHVGGRRRAQLADTLAGLEHDGLGAVAEQEALPVVDDQHPRAPRTLVAEPDSQAVERSAHRVGGGADDLLTLRHRHTDADPAVRRARRRAAGAGASRRAPAIDPLTAPVARPASSTPAGRASRGSCSSTSTSAWSRRRNESARISSSRATGRTHSSHPAPSSSRRAVTLDRAASTSTTTRSAPSARSIDTGSSSTSRTCSTSMPTG